MIPPCDRLHAFFDGELAADEVAEMHRHLADCVGCQLELHELMQTDDLMARWMPPPRMRPRPGTIKIWSSRLFAGLAVGATALAILVVWPRSSNREPSVALALSERRGIEGRLSYADADRHRPYDVARGETVTIEPISMKWMEARQELGDRRGLIAGQILLGSRQQASALLREAAVTPEDDNDRALLALIDGKPPEALTLADRALAARPRFAPALWNRALALRDMGLPMGAAQAFDSSAALGAPGWTEEAIEHSESLRRLAATKVDAYAHIAATALRMTQNMEPLATDDIRLQPDVARRWLYDAVRAAPSRESVEKLLPAADELDRIYGGRELRRTVEQAVRANFVRRGPLAAAYARLLAGEKLDDAALDALVASARRAGQTDILLGALLRDEDERVPARFVPEYLKLAKASTDPWFRFLAVEQEAESLRDGKLWGEAEAVLLEGLNECSNSRLAHRCAWLRFRLGNLYHTERRVTQADKVLTEVWEYARKAGDWPLESKMLSWMGEVASLSDDVSGASLAITQAYLGEWLAWTPGNCEHEAYGHRALAMLLLNRNETSEARRELDQSVAARRRCGLPLNRRELFVGAHLARPGAESDELRREIAEFRTRPDQDAGDRAYVDQIEGRLLVRTDRAAGEALLRRAIAAAATQPEATSSAQARSYSYAVLVMTAAKAGEPERVLELLAEDLHVSAPGRCVLGVMVEDGSVVAARGADGSLRLGFQPEWYEPSIDATRLVPREVLATLAGCEVVDVLAAPPVRGRPGLLPPDMAWRYGVGGRSTRPRPTDPRRLVVADVAFPASLSLPALAPWHSSAAPTVLVTGARATPTRVLAEARSADVIEINAHGVTNSAGEDASYIVLAPDESGRFALTAAQIGRERLIRSPLVILATCRAAAAPGYYHETSTMPEAFLRAGASTVLASPEPIQDAEATKFFDAVRTRIESGVAAAIAVRDERAQWLKRGGKSWVSSVLVFE